MEYHINEIVRQSDSIVVIGNFDGVHLGHQKLFAAAVEAKGDMDVLALSFFPHPTWILSGAKKEIITPTRDKIEVMKSLGVDIFVEYPFTLELANMNAYDFFDKILIEDLKAKVVVVGEDYRFGKARKAGIAELAEMCEKKGVRLCVVKKLMLEGEKVSSTQIRRYLAEGAVEDASKLLGYTYKIVGKVIKGKQLGRTIGFKTANISTKEGVLYPKNGVYATKVKVYNKEFLAITNIGYNPTVGGKVKMIESNIFDFEKEIYDEEIEVSFLKFIRPEKKFVNLNDLKMQIITDKEKTLRDFTTF
ncbi:bifunctional riboflavin kinase/FAD synthetase [Candidatus Epulonipiscium viviparus]|uniref:bifunctional riboflavin kinase/FAD synthetase n=1 Tax=Candidatus Epulonipiscium viviparus TaxID=420336 RepID=UPI00016C0EBB|nr:bifunctional riboflavin kinase/FAD synthetase [Candidatus Epulopiscium viviparus]